MILKYKINKSYNYITFCNKKNKSYLSKSLDSIETDKNVLLLYDNKIDKKIINNIFEDLKSSGCNIFSIRSNGEKINKNENFLFNIIDFLLKNKFTKRSVIISCGGGVIGDVAALASSLYLRGLYYYNIPSTMTAIIDSSIGGKTAINYKGIINSIGTYYHPKNVFILQDIINKLPKREFLAGIAEVIKCGLIGNKEILKFLKTNKEKILEREHKLISKLCYLTLKTKINFFINDIYENNKRLNLNFGHTFAHSIEMAIEGISKKEIMRHGEAVGLGMLCEIYYSNKGKSKLYNFTKDLLEDYSLPTSISCSELKIKKLLLQNNIYKNIFFDKKKINKFPRYISLKKQGNPIIKEIKDFDFLNDTILEIIE